MLESGGCQRGRGRVCRWSVASLLPSPSHWGGVLVSLGAQRRRGFGLGYWGRALCDGHSTARWGMRARCRRGSLVGIGSKIDWAGSVRGRRARVTLCLSIANGRMLFLSIVVSTGVSWIPSGAVWAMTRCAGFDFADPVALPEGCGDRGDPANGVRSPA